MMATPSASSTNLVGQVSKEWRDEDLEKVSRMLQRSREHKQRLRPDVMMGNTTLKEEYDDEKDSGATTPSALSTVSSVVSLEDFEILTVLGKGAYGKVFQVTTMTHFHFFVLNNILSCHENVQNDAKILKSCLIITINGFLGS